ncbi:MULTISPECIES: NfeD family protein [Butyrivibrio]|uniref:NfeD family protein n=1 Tax=Butyrivibrio TaxID=830 RepID=UPI00041DBA81|nr:MULTISPECIES: NfeD family protein [Butyrivibrio]
MDFISTPAGYWLIITVVFALIELATVGLVTIWFAAGSFVAMILALVGAGIPVQIAVFVLVSVICIAAVRPLATKHFNNKLTKTNIDSVIGKKLIVKTRIDNMNESGKVELEGSIWLARSVDDDTVISEGEEVVVEKIVGNKLMVKKVTD